MVDEEIQRSLIACAVRVSDEETDAVEHGYRSSKYWIIPIQVPLRGTFFGLSDRRLHRRHPKDGESRFEFSSGTLVFTDESLSQDERRELNECLASGDYDPVCARRVRELLRSGLYRGPIGLNLHVVE